MARLRVLAGDFHEKKSGSYSFGKIRLHLTDGTPAQYQLEKDVRALIKRDHKWLASAARQTALTLATFGMFNVFRVGQNWSFGKVIFEMKFNDGRRLVSSVSGRLWMLMDQRFEGRAS